MNHNPSSHDPCERKEGRILQKRPRNGVLVGEAERKRRSFKMGCSAAWRAHPRTQHHGTHGHRDATQANEAWLCASRPIGRNTRCGGRRWREPLLRRGTCVMLNGYTHPGSAEAAGGAAAGGPGCGRRRH